MVSLDPDAMDVVEAHPTTWAIRLEGSWSRRGLLHPSTDRWYFINSRRGSWYYLTDLPDQSPRRTGTSRWALEPTIDDPPIEAGEIVHSSCAPTAVQLWAAGFRPTLDEADGLEDVGGQQQDLAGWTG